MSLPAWLAPLPDAAAMRAADAAAIAAGTTGLELMERAAAGLARIADATLPAGRIAVVCGKGNNGGDGWAAARMLAEAGRDVVVVALASPGELAGDARANADRWTGPTRSWSPAALDGCDGAIDALLGTGFAGTPRGAIGEAVAALAAWDRLVVAADVPSGVDASTGEVAGAAVRAAATATFAQAKPGLWIHPGKAHAGRVEVVPIGVRADAAAGLLGPGVLDLVPRRGAASTKFTSGHVLVAGGSRGLTGAPCLAAAAAARAGAGYVTALVPASLEAIFEVKLTEVMTLALPDDDGSHVPAGARVVAGTAQARGGALVLGPGLGRADAAQAFAREAALAPVPLVLDADGLNAHAGDLPVLAERAHATVLTPHAGELARLLGVSSAEVGAARLAHARRAAGEARAVVVLKGDDTLVVAPDGRVAVSPGDAPGLATAGTGDVLAGTVGALLAAGLGAFEAACAGVVGHLVAGRLAAEPHGPGGVIASDVIAALPAAFAAR